MASAMKYRFLGNSGLLVSVLGVGSFTLHNLDTVDEAYEMLKHAFRQGVNFWDSAEIYSSGVSEKVLGLVLQRGINERVWTREDLVLTTKMFGGTKEGPNAKGLSRKHVVEGTNASLKRLGVKYVDVLYLHRPEKFTSIEEVVRAMNFIIDQGWALYWGTSQWQEQDILEACEIADRLRLIRPIVEQPEYSLFVRSKVEVEFRSLYDKYKLGLTTWSPLAYGILTGKYADGVPETARLALPMWEKIIGDISDRVAQTEELRPIAEELGCSAAQLAIAWCVTNENVASVLIGATTLAQLDENLQALRVVDKITREIKRRIEDAVPIVYKPPTRDSYYTLRATYLNDQTMATSGVGMKYRFLGDSGLLVSAFGFGCMVQSDADVDVAYELVVHAFRHGVNFFDTAEVYGAGASERAVGAVIQRGIENGEWTREDLVISTKLFFGPNGGPNGRGLSRKHIVEGAKGSLARLGLSYADVLFCHRPDKFTPVEEVVRAMNFVIDQGLAFYWGTSEWHETDVLAACEVADRLGLVRPIVEQPEYNLIARSRVEVEFQALYSKYKLGLTTWSPLAFGLLTGKYANGIPESTRLSNAYFAGLIGDVDARAAQVEKLRPIAEELGCSLAQLALAWAASNHNVSTVLLGAKTIAQLDENLKAFAFVAKITPEIKTRIEEAVPFEFKPSTYDSYYTIRQQYL